MSIWLAKGDAGIHAVMIIMEIGAAEIQSSALSLQTAIKMMQTTLSLWHTSLVRVKPMSGIRETAAHRWEKGNQRRWSQHYAQRHEAEDGADAHIVVREDP